MNSISNQMTARIPSGFALPISGHDLGSTSLRCVASWTTGTATSVAKDRKAVMGFAQGYFPGTSAWRPPNC